MPDPKPFGTCSTLQRREVIPEYVNDAIGRMVRQMQFRLDQKGHGTFASKHEALGVITEEYNELIKAVTEDKPLKGQVEHELLDIAVACIFSVACIEAGTMDW